MNEHDLLLSLIYSRLRPRSLLTPSSPRVIFMSESADQQQQQQQQLEDEEKKMGEDAPLTSQKLSHNYYKDYGNNDDHYDNDYDTFVSSEESENSSVSYFDRDKVRFLGKIDKSAAGRIDAKAVAICAAINLKRDYYTTSSCSGEHDHHHHYSVQLSLHPPSFPPPPPPPLSLYIYIYLEIKILKPHLLFSLSLSLSLSPHSLTSKSVVVFSSLPRPSFFMTHYSSKQI